MVVLSRGGLFMFVNHPRREISKCVYNCAFHFITKRITHGLGDLLWLQSHLTVLYNPIYGIFDNLLDCDLFRNLLGYLFRWNSESRRN